MSKQKWLRTGIQHCSVIKLAYMKDFAIKLILFLLPFTIIPIINYTVDSYYVFGRSKQLAEIADTLLSGKSITGLVNFNDRYLQKQIIRKMKKIPDVIALGSSQTMELRTSYLGKPPGSFFNHSVAAGNLHDMIAILGCYKKRGQLPKQIIIGVSVSSFIDKLWEVAAFGDRWQTLASEYYYLQTLIEKRDSFSFEFFLRAEAAIQEYKLLFSFNYALTNFKNIKYLLENDLLFRVAEEDSIDQKFFRSDGSYHRNLKYDDTETLKRTESYINDLKKTKDYEIINKELFINLVDYLLSCGSQVIFFLPPYHPMFYKELLKNKTLGVYLEVEKLIMDIARSRHIPICGSYDPSNLGLESKNFLDATHPRDFTLEKIFNGFTPLTSHTIP